MYEEEEEWSEEGQPDPVFTDFDYAVVDLLVALRKSYGFLLWMLVFYLVGQTCNNETNIVLSIGAVVYLIFTSSRILSEYND